MKASDGVVPDFPTDIDYAVALFTWGQRNPPPSDEECCIWGSILGCSEIFTADNWTKVRDWLAIDKIKKGAGLVKWAERLRRKEIDLNETCSQ